MKIELNNKQKQFLFDKGYVTSKTLDACVEEGWQDYFKEEYEWVLETQRSTWGFRTLRLYDKGYQGDYVYEIDLNFQGDDLLELL